MSKNNKKTAGDDFVRDFFKKYPKFYYFIAVCFGPLMLTGLSPKKFISKYLLDEMKVINVGSGPRRINENVINIDIFEHKGVDIIASLKELPLKNDSVDGIICDNVLEHVENPSLAIQEMYRVLKPGGYLYVSTPFLYPFHGSPSDYQRWTKKGMEHLLRDFLIKDSSLRAGPASALTIWCCYAFATLFSFGNDRLYWLLINMALFIFFPIKILDLILNHLPNAVNMAASIYCVVQKK